MNVDYNGADAVEAGALKGESILCFAPDPWDDIWRNRHQIMSRLAQRNTVLYVEPRAYLRDVVARLKAGEIRPADLWPKPVRHIQDGLYVYTPPLCAPLSGRQPIKWISDGLRKRSLCRAMRSLAISRPILWLFRPDMADVPGRYGESFLIYHIVDEYTGYAGVDSIAAKRVAERERELIARANLVMVTSQSLLENKRGLNPHTYWVPNAVDYAAFKRAADARVEPQELADIRRPRVAYVGAINDKLDTDLLLDVSRALPEISLVLVGPERPTTEAMRQGLSALRAESNVHFVGRLPVERVAPIMAACDVGLLPYKRNAWTEHIHPLKMFEYLACGLPVVSTDIPSVHAEDEFVDIVEDADAFATAVRQELSAHSPEHAAARQARASQNTWEQRIEAISSLVRTVRSHAEPVVNP